MRTLSEVLASKDYYTQQASAVTRQLAFAGFAVIWLLKSTGPRPIQDDVVLALLLFAATLGLDILHYALSSFIWVVFYNVQYKKANGKLNTEIDIPGILNWFGYGCFWAKLVTLLIGWGELIEAIATRWGFW